ncbi:MAG: hypothetical protein UW84_C0032G0002 [Candidatus Collierbacteria bacterium GW2011_GWA2_44_99]|uniref:Uncharacterized protein n=1 Tax=Candidatus Collierbacteria bacterium GW2011_GWA2_44_99 TaxID=1618380 RepID=A0A0G1KPK4_9BACT|nr:MAG: hypothetical protein UW84_C0032G0002 [Candidatus Collierbacteria bacterium GW2011_GWA2_44_99]
MPDQVRHDKEHKTSYNETVIIESSNAKEPKNHTGLSVMIVVASCIFFFIPTTLIVLGYLSSQPTGSLISPLPQGVLSQITPTPSVIQEELRTENRDLPIIAAPNDATASSPTNITPLAGSNIIDKTATISAGNSPSDIVRYIDYHLINP